eukprot:6471200-Amphidinium_carterae.1
MQGGKRWCRHAQGIQTTIHGTTSKVIEYGHSTSKYNTNGEQRCGTSTSVAVGGIAKGIMRLNALGHWNTPNSGYSSPLGYRCSGDGIVMLVKLSGYSAVLFCCKWGDRFKHRQAALRASC